LQININFQLLRDRHFLSRKSLVEKKALMLNSITRQARGTPAPRAALLKKLILKHFDRAPSLLACRYFIKPFAVFLINKCLKLSQMPIFSAIFHKSIVFKTKDKTKRGMSETQLWAI